MSGLRVLLLSSSPLLTTHLRELLQDAGHQLVPVIDLAACRRALAAHQADLILIATSDGSAVAAALRDDLAQGEILLLSPDPTDAEAARNAGALFLQLPCADDELLLALLAATRPRKLILLCDDSTLIHRHTTPILTEAGYDVRAAHDGDEGLRLASSLRPDLVITDVEMPRLDGYELCRAIKARWPQLPLIICSALGEAQDVERGFDSGADDYLIKPAEPHDLISRVAMLLGAGRRMPTRERLLVVDDSHAVRHLITESLRRQGFAVLTAEDGEAGLRLARAERPAMIVTDYDMPRMTGFELVHALKQDARTRDIPVMMLTARSGRRDQAQMRAIGLTAYLVKPFTVDKCVAMVERILAEGRLRAYKTASRLYISDATVRAAEEVAQSGDLRSVRATEQVAAVLFTDIAGFTQIAAQRTPREVVELLNSYFDALCPAIVEEGGDIDKFIGDSIMAIFEENRDRPQSAGLRAVRAGLHMQRALRRWNVQTGNTLGMRVGINIGPVVRGDIGSRHVRRDYTVIGDVVNRAQRFEANAPVGGVLIGELLYQRVRAHVRCESRPGVRLKGVDEPVQAYLALDLLDEEQAQR